MEVTVPNDMLICDEEDISLDGMIDGNYDEFIWCENGEETNYDLDEIVPVDEPTTFTLKAYYLSTTNSISNGDFELGDTDFYTDYEPAIGNCFHGAGFLGCEGVYAIIDDPSLGHTAFEDCGDHTGGGLMMVVNGAASLQNIWCQEICVDPEADYLFSAWAASVNPGSPAILQFSIDGSLIGDIFSLTSSTCSWEFFEAEWSADGATTVEICVTNQNTAAGGNDFALDDIAFYKRCKDEKSFDVGISDFEIIFGPTDDLTCTEPENQVTIDIDPPGDYDIIWDTDDGNIVEIINDGYALIVNSAGIYAVTVTDENGCIRESDFEVYADAEIPEFYLEADGNLDCNNPEVEIFIDYDNDYLEFTWSNADNSNISMDDFLIVTEGGTYQVTGYDTFTGCEKTEEIDIVQDTIAPFFNINKSNDLDCSNQQTTISIDTVASNIIWSGPSNFIGNPNSNTLTTTVPGTYTASIINPNGCEYLDSINVIEIDPEFNYSVDADALIDCNSPLSQIEVSLDTANYNIDWLSLPNAYNDSLVFNLNNGAIYPFQITDTLGCEKLDTIIITEDFELPNALQVNGGQIDCSQAEIEINTNNPNDYDIIWVHENGTTGSGNTFAVSQPGEVTYTYADDNGCSVTESLTILASTDTPIVTISGGILDCNTPSVDLFINSNQPLLSYSWSFENGALLGDNNIAVTESGTYSVEVVNEDGCSVTAEYFVDIDTIGPTITAPSDITLNCDVDIYYDELVIDSPISEIVANGDWYEELNNSITIEEAGYYEIVAQGINGCETQVSFEALIDTNKIDISIDSDNLLDCNTDIIFASATTSDSYNTIEWTGPNFISDQEDIEITESGMYSISAIGDNGCISTEELVIFEDYTEPEFEVSASLIDCAHDFSTIEVNSNQALSDISYYDANGDPLGSGATFDTDMLSVITVIVTGENGCTSEDVVTIIEDNSTFNFSLEAPDLGCSGNPVFINVIDNLQISESAIFDSNNVLIGDIDSPISEQGIYTVTILLDNGCESSQDIEVFGDIEQITFTIIPDSNLDCNNTETPLYITSSSVYDSFSVYNSNGDFVGDETILINEPGEYTAEIIANNGCSSIETFEIIESERLEEITFTTDPLDCSEIVEFNITEFNGPSNNYEINIEGSSTQLSNNIYQVEGAGIRNIEIYDPLTGCTLDTSFVIEPVIALEVQEIPEVTIAEGEEVNLELILNRPIEDIESIRWFNENLTCNEDCLTTTYTGSESTSFFVYVEDKNGCNTEIEVRISVLKLITIYAPNVMTISGSGSDSNNSGFTIFSKNGDITQIESLSIYDRWGNKVFAKENFPANDLSEGWNGYYNAAPVEQGVYVYHAIVELSDETKETLSGSLTVFR